MSQREQKKFIDTLKRFQSKMDEKERRDFSMFVKRHKDDEELDKLSMSKLRALYEKYYVHRPKRNFDDIFKKPDDSGSGASGE